MIAAGLVAASLLATSVLAALTDAADRAEAATKTAVKTAVKTTKKARPTTAATAPKPATAGAAGDLRVGFKSSAVRVAEGAPAVLQLTLSGRAPVGTVIGLSYAVGTASLRDATFAADLQPVPSVTVAAGATTVSVPIPITNDEVAEADETFTVRIDAAKTTGVSVDAARPVATVTIVDNDRSSLTNVRSVGAKGDGVTDDTAAVQRAMNTAMASNGGVVVFPAGTYLVRSVNIGPAMTIQGEDGATILRPPNMGKWTRTFTTENRPYESDTDSPVLLIRGLVFDGNSSAQGAYQSHQLEQAHLVFLTGSPKRAGRLFSVVDDVEFRNGVGDGLSLFTNTTTRVTNVRGRNMFRGVVTLTGGASQLDVDGVTTTATTDSTGIDVEVDGPGYKNSLAVQVKLRNLELDGYFDVAVADGSVVDVRSVVAKRGPFFVSNYRSTMTVADSSFVIGGADQFANRIVYPGNLTFERTTFNITEDASRNPRLEFYGLDVWWSHPTGPPVSGAQVLTMRGSSFAVVGGPAPLRGIVSRFRAEGRDRLDVGDTTFDARFGASPVNDIGS